MKEKKYYWLKLKDNFFDDDTIRYIEEQENGIKYSNFYLKLCLKSVRTHGRLIRLVGETLIPYDVKSLSNLTNVDFDTVNSAMTLFKQLGIINILDNGELYMSQVQELIGSETEKAPIMRRKRAEEKQKNCVGNNVTKKLPYIEIEIEKDIDIEKDLKKKTNKAKPLSNKFDIDFIKQVIDYLNSKTNSKFRTTTKKYQALIMARKNQDFVFDDFKKVIDVKYEQWVDNDVMNKFLRPETLFGTKFESYLNEYKSPKEFKNILKNNIDQIDLQDYEDIDINDILNKFS